MYQRFFTIIPGTNYAAAAAAPTLCKVVDNGLIPATTVNIMFEGKIVATRNLALSNTPDRTPWTADELAQVAGVGSAVTAIVTNPANTNQWSVTFN
jgi:hypothetical protein